MKEMEKDGRGRRERDRCCPYLQLLDPPVVLTVDFTCAAACRYTFLNQTHKALPRKLSVTLEGCVDLKLKL